MKNTLAKIFAYKSPWEEDSKPNENVFTRKRKNFGGNMPNLEFNFNNNVLYIVIALAIIGWLASGIFTVKEGEEAVVLRFGQYNRTSTPGLNYHLPEPLEKAIVERVNKSRRIEIGYRSSTAATSRNSRLEGAKYVPAESIMLTGDENIADISTDVIWHIGDLMHYVFNIANPEETIKGVAESAIREVIGQTLISSILSNQKQEIAIKIETEMQRVLDLYKTGIIVDSVQLLRAEPPEQVLDSYRDVQTSKSDKERLVNQAQAYSNDILPRARGEAARLIQDAEAYKSKVITKSEGDSQRFLAIYEEYVQAKQVTKDRLYLDTTEEVLKGSSKVVMGADMLPHMDMKAK